MPCSRQRSGTDVPASAWLRMPRIWRSLNRDFRMWNLLSCHYENFPLLSNTNFRGDYRGEYPPKQGAPGRQDDPKEFEGVILPPDKLFALARFDVHQPARPALRGCQWMICDQKENH